MIIRFDAVIMESSFNIFISNDFFFWHQDIFCHFSEESEWQNPHGLRAGRLWGGLTVHPPIACFLDGAIINALAGLNSVKQRSGGYFIDI